MARYSPIKNSFVAGELSPRLEGRDDIDQYFQGMRRAINGIVLPHGGFMRRPGTRFVDPQKTESRVARMIPFQVSVEQAYVIEMGHLYGRFFANEGVLLTGGGSDVEVVTVFEDVDLADLHYAQDIDRLWLVHPDYHPYRLIRTSPTAFSIGKIAWREGRAPMQPKNLTATTLTVTGSGPYTLTWSSSIGLASGNDVGRYVTWNDVDYYEITSVGSTSVATATLRSSTPSPTLSTANANWSLGMFSDTEGARSVGLHDGRLGFFGSRTRPSWNALSNSDDFDYFKAGTGDDDAVYFNTTAGRTDAVQWAISADEILLIGTAATEFKLSASDGVVTPTDNATKPTTARGSAHIQALNIDSEVLFIQRNRRKLRVWTFDLQKDGRVARDISILAEHILKAGAVSLAYQQDPDSVVWVLRRDGVIVGFTYEREQRVNGAHRHILGGTFGAGSAVVESIAVIPSPDGTQDQLWMTVKRTINGSTRRYIEFMVPPFDPNPEESSAEERAIALEETPFSDCSLTLDNPLTISAITAASPGVFTSTSHGLSDNDSVRLRNIEGFEGSAGSMSDLNNLSYIVDNATTHTFTLVDQDGNAVSTANMGAYIGSGQVYEETTTIAGLSHLEGQTVDIQADGTALIPQTVVSGSITLPNAASIVHVGLNYRTIGETMRFLGGGRLGTDQGRPQNLKRLIARVYETLGVEFKQGNKDDTALEYKPVHNDEDPMDRTPPYFSGDLEITLNGGWAADPTITFEQNYPLPLTILALIPYAESNEK